MQCQTIPSKLDASDFIVTKFKSVFNFNVKVFNF